MPSKQEQATKGVALSVATALIAWSGQMVAQGNYTTAGAGAALGIAVFVGYQALEERAHRSVYNDIIGAIGEQRFKSLANHSDETLNRLAEMAPEDAEALLGTDNSNDGSDGS